MALRAIFKKLTLKQHFSSIFRNYVVFNESNLFKTERISTPNCSIKIHKHFLCSNYNSDSEQTEEDDEISDFNEQTSIRNLLNKDSTDPLIQKLNESASVQNVFNIIRENNLNADQITQAVLILWDLQKIFYTHNLLFENDNNSNTVLSSNAILKNYVDQVNAHKDFEKLLQLIELNYEKFTLDALTCTLLYLNRMGVKLNSKIMELMITRCAQEIKNCADPKMVPLTALSRFIVTVDSQKQLLPILTSINVVSIIFNRLETCKTAEDFKLLTICLNKMNQLVTNETLNIYKRQATKLINEKIITIDNKRTIIKMLRFLNQPEWFEYNTDISNKCMHLLKGHVDQLNNHELILLFKVFQTQKEPADMLEEIQNHASKLLSDTADDIEQNLEINLDLLSCIVSFSSPLQRPKFESIAKRYITNNLTPLSLSALYKILYHIKSSDTKLCNSFWDKLLEYINTDTSPNKLPNLLSVCYKYIHFNETGNRYRYYHFESTILKLLLEELDNNSELTNSLLCRIASFIIAYSTDSTCIETIINTVIAKVNEITPIDCLNLSKAFQFALENNRFRNDANLAISLKKLAHALNQFTLTDLNNNTTEFPNVNILLRSFVLRKENIDTQIFKNMLQFYGDSNYLSSHRIKDLTFALQINNCLNPDAIEKSIEYILKKKQSILGNTVDKIVYLCYSLGYTPQKSDEFFDIATELIIRDKDRFSGLGFLQSCLALCYYHKLPEELIQLIFSVGFLEKLDEELSNCYAKTTYPFRVRDHLMQLNRAVCLDYPETSVPWFHQKFTDELSKQVRKKNYFHKQILAILKDLMRDTNSEIIENSYSPYGYRLDFELKYDSKNTEASKTAIILLNPKSHTNQTVNLKGYSQLKQRHLEILGYTVIQIRYSDWKSLYTQASCIEYVKKKIWPTDSALSSMSY